MPPRRRSSLRTSAGLSAGALALHELRYLIGWDGGAGRALAEQGHAYLSFAMPLAVALGAAGLGHILWRLGADRRSPEETGPPRIGPAVAGYGAALLALYAAQETVEGVVEAGHPGGLGGVFGHGGLVAVPLALAIGALIAWTERGARTAMTTGSRLRVSRPGAGWPAPGPGPAPAGTGRTGGPAAGAAGAGLARHLAGRAPPLVFG